MDQESTVETCAPQKASYHSVAIYKNSEASEPSLKEGVYQSRLAYKRTQVNVAKVFAKTPLRHQLVCLVHPKLFLCFSVVSPGFSIGISVSSQQGLSASFVPGFVLRLCPLRV